ncbi:PAK-box/P21-Rho-binding protein [Akanthomyces lecanii RCEF 1005]|uniref:PAK-box/P21-Rho-binding protein n=1 Tax=Akanthomyces lecanii RCEF 1005 TaxID=1081108 RepID=A0A162JPI9_CORDF|nr:PAK-box/P21-Rho-binding protein [Akanthomyces lecanii RCEF 1005]
MWANGSPSYFSGLYSVPTVPLLRDRPAKNVDKTCASRRDQTPDSTGNYLASTDLYLPAVEGPPSPESLRRLNTEMRLATSLRRGQGHKVGSSSSSITSFTGDLDHALDNIDLVRRSSFTSVESNNISKDASEAFQQFSKSLFHRRGRSKQESTSSGSSLYSADVPVDANASKDSVLPKLFTRRKPSREEPAAVQKRFQISGPFNFQHVTHTNRDAADEVMPEDDQADAYQVKGRSRAATGASDHTYTNVLAETVAEHEDFSDFPPPRHGLIARHTGSFQTMRRFIKSGKISELSVPIAPTSAPTNRLPPQRPPRSPLEANSPESTSPPRPPRVSSRQSAYPAPIDTTASYFSERPITSGGFQRPQPFSPSSPVEQLPTPTRSAFTPPADLSTFSQEGLLGRPRTATPEPAWPLASPTIANFEAPLPDLVEDDGHTSWSSRARTSQNSTNASLRGSKSVPMLRKLAEEGVDKEMEASAWSAQMKTELEESLCHSPTLGRASWEDDIDYCYEHEAEADCDYQWERPSMDVAHGGMMYTAPQSYSALDEALMKPAVKRSPGMLSASGFDVPELSPASQTSAVLGHEAITPLTHHAAANSLFRHIELSVPVKPHNSHEYQFSPSLLIPQEYQRDSLTADNGISHGLESLQRSSTATTGSNYTSSTDSVGERHTSTNSSWTALTQHTASTLSLNKLAMSWVDEAEPVPCLTAPAKVDDATDEETTPPASEDVVPELIMAIPPSGRRAMHKSHASESILRNSAAPMDAQQLPKSRRPRARTSSLSQPPPVGQYALFPRSNIKTHGDKI